MSNFLTEKLYNLQFIDEDADDEAAEKINVLCGKYKLIGSDIIPSANEGENFEYYIFINVDNRKTIEIFRNEDEYCTLVFYGRDKISTANYSDYLECGWDEFPEFAGPHCDSILSVTITETDA